jgi:hypothetical protein
MIAQCRAPSCASGESPEKGPWSKPAFRKPITRPPSGIAKRDSTIRPGNLPPNDGSKGSTLTPSNRHKPFAVPTQRYPSLVWASAWIEPRTPSLAVQLVCCSSESARSRVGARAVVHGATSSRHTTTRKRSSSSIPARTTILWLVNRKSGTSHFTGGRRICGSLFPFQTSPLCPIEHRV